VRATSLDSTREERWSLAGAWELTELGTDRYAVLVGIAPYWQWHAVIDLEDGWVGYLPPITPAQ
jgi:hypothetical protein